MMSSVKDIKLCQLLTFTWKIIEMIVREIAVRRDIMWNENCVMLAEVTATDSIECIYMEIVYEQTGKFTIVSEMCYTLNC